MEGSQTVERADGAVPPRTSCARGVAVDRPAALGDPKEVRTEVGSVDPPFFSGITRYVPDREIPDSPVHGCSLRLVSMGYSTLPLFLRSLYFSSSILVLLFPTLFRLFSSNSFPFFFFPFFSVSSRPFPFLPPSFFGTRGGTRVVTEGRRDGFRRTRDFGDTTTGVTE